MSIPSQSITLHHFYYVFYSRAITPISEPPAENTIWVPAPAMSVVKLCMYFVLLSSTLNKAELKQSFCGRMPFLSPTSSNHSLYLIFSQTTKTPEQRRGVTPFTSALRRQYIVHRKFRPVPKESAVQE